MANKLAIDGGQPVRTDPFPSWPIYDEQEEQALLDVIHSGKWGLGGNQVETFARRFAAYQDARFGVCVPNGTQALELALRTLEIGPGAEVIAPPYTFVATISPILWLGAKPVFVDIDWNSFNLDPSKVEAAITERTKAIMPVHLGGRPADLDVLSAVAERHNLPLIEDAAQAWGAGWRGRGVGAQGTMGGFSFQSSKNINAGEGGILLTNDPDLYERAWSLHNTGRSRTSSTYEMIALGGNMRMTEWVAAVLNVQLDRLPQQAARREDNARYLAYGLAEVPGLDPLPDDERITGNSRHLFMMHYDQAAFGDHSRDEFVQAMRAEGITTCSPGYVTSLVVAEPVRNAISKQFGAAALPDPAAYPVTLRASAEGVWFTQTTMLGEKSDIDTILAAVHKIQTVWG